MNTYTITTIYSEHEYDHGTIEIKKKDNGEWQVEGDFNLTVDSCDYHKMCQEIQDIIRKYAL